MKIDNHMIVSIETTKLERNDKIIKICYGKFWSLWCYSKKVTTFVPNIFFNLFIIKILLVCIIYFYLIIILARSITTNRESCNAHQF